MVLKIFNFGHILEQKSSLRLIRGSTYTRVYTVNVSKRKKENWFLALKEFPVNFEYLKLHLHTRFQRAFTACACVFEVITLVDSNQRNYFENARSKPTLKTRM